MARFRGLGLTVTVLMIVGTVRGRWLEPESYLTLSTPSSSLISDGIDDDYVNHNNTRDYLLTGDSNSSDSTPMLYGEKRCESIYGFLPCADTMAEGVFLMVLYSYLMMTAEAGIREGSEALFLLLGDYKMIGPSIFRVLMASPRIVIVIVAGIVSKESDAQNQVAFGVGLYAGSTFLTLTFIWGLRIILNQDKLRGTESIPGHEQQEEDSSTKCLPLKHKLSNLNDKGVNIDEGTGYMAVMMLLSMIPFAIVEVVAIIKRPDMILLPLIVSCMSLVVYFGYQISNPLIGLRSLAYLKKENLQIRFFYHIQRIAKDDLIDEQGKPNTVAFERFFKEADMDRDDWISHDELETLIAKVFDLEEESISMEYAKAEILTHFDDDDKSGKISREEFQKGYTKWFKKCEKDANDSNSKFKNIWKQIETVAIRNKREDLTKIKMIMSKIMQQVLGKHGQVKQNKEANRKTIEELFSKYDDARDNKMHRSEFKKLIEDLNFGVSLDNEKIYDEIAKDFDNTGNQDTITKNEFVEGFLKWIDKAIAHYPNIEDLNHAIAKYEEDCWAEIDTPKDMVKPKASIVYVIFSIFIMFLLSKAFMQSVLQFSNAAHIPFHLTSFIVFPIAMNARTVITSLLRTGSHVSKNASLTFSEMYNGLVMNNLLGLLTLLVIVYAKGLSWTYSYEVAAIMVPCLVVGIFARKRDTYPLWASYMAIALAIVLYLFIVIRGFGA